VSAHGGNKEGSEDNLSTTEGRQREPQEEDELEDKVEGKPVDNVDKAFQDSEEGEDDPVGKPLGVVVGVVCEESAERVVAGNDEASKVGQKLATHVEDNEEEVEGSEANDTIGFGNASLLLEVVEGGVLGQLSVQSAQVVLSLILSGSHFGSWLFVSAVVREECNGIGILSDSLSRIKL
jgi:hypothetical protein